ncbi:MAG: AI-2E family transporter [Clostridiales bacterium]|jgi:predicted PurR-regulated permease PerM|nr:AI-2E family transporter [Clostridiales bacterium]
MKLPWDKKYLLISFHVIITFAVLYALKLILDASAHLLFHLPQAVNSVLLAAAKFFSVIKSAIAGFVIAYLFDPVVDYLQTAANKIKHLRKKTYKNANKMRKNANVNRRTCGTVLLYIILLSLLAAPVIALVKAVNENGAGEMLSGFSRSLNQMGEGLRAIVQKLNTAFTGRGSQKFLVNVLTAIYEKTAGVLKTLTGKAAVTLPAAVSFILNIFLGLVIAFFFLRDKYAIKEGIHSFTNAVLSEKAASKLRKTASDIHWVFSGYIRGQVADATIVACIMFFFLTVIGVDYAPFIAVLSGIANLIPYLGAVVCFVLAVSVAFISASPYTALCAAIGIIIIQQIDTFIIAPKVIGERVRLGPAAVIISLAVAGEAAGIAGMIFAVPVAAAAKLFILRKVKKTVIKNGD